MFVEIDVDGFAMLTGYEETLIDAQYVDKQSAPCGGFMMLDSGGCLPLKSSAYWPVVALS